MILVEFSDGKKVIYNVEWQTYNDPEMRVRMLVQQSVLYSIHKLPVIGIVIYSGKKKMNMSCEIVYEGFYYRYNLIDLSKYDPGDFLDSEIPDEIIMAILAGKLRADEIRLLIKNILFKLHLLLGDDLPELSRKIVQLEVLSEIKGVQGVIIEEEKNMPLILDDSKSIRFQQGVSKATSERNTAFVTYLLQHTNHSIEQIAGIVNVPVDFVTGIKKKLDRS